MRLTALVFRRLNDMKHGKKDVFDPSVLTFKPDLTASKKSKPPAPIKPVRRSFANTGSRIMGSNSISQNGMKKSGQASNNQSDVKLHNEDSDSDV